MKLKGVVFDLNGTLYWDTKIHNNSWDIFLDAYNVKISDKEKNNIIHGKNGKDIFSAIFSRELSQEEVNIYTQRKEIIYRDLCLKTEMKLAPGAIEFLELLKQNNIPYTIATASVYENVCFFFEMLKLYKYFDLSRVVFNDGTISGKPNPDLFLKAIQILELKTTDTLIFEDSLSGIAAAENAKVGKIIIVDSNDDDYGPLMYEKIKDFADVNRNYFF